MNTLSERLQKAMDDAGLSQAELALRVGVSQPAIWRLVAGKTNTTRKLVEIAHALGVSPEWLSTGKDTSDQPGGHRVENLHGKKQAGNNDVFRVEVLDLSVSAGPGTFMVSDYVEVLHAIEYTTEHARSLFGNRSEDAVKVMTVNGDSMANTFNSGDRVFVDISVRHFMMDGVYVFVFGKTLHLKRLQMQGKKLAVLSDNPAYEKWYIEEADQDQFYVMGKALIHESINYQRL
ncbi:XRE family transcriptional regulator [Klebsiella aerogenes]|uniref:XRE family transcriptional regulator n=1 Tax=Klebsiella aerogenes TaxID=548 RepID=UPI0022DDBA0A|nr:helix-turn-helix transcriptional regulator [Klebsiella aerogenes]ELA2324220.1 helix-turn-helix transcriptional regulator [Klebsiella aerogenes]WBN62686.1 helix-turn-helix transcriptional regulator [Klebsiella aerogenes]